MKQLFSWESKNKKKEISRGDVKRGVLGVETYPKWADWSGGQQSTLFIGPIKGSDIKIVWHWPSQDPSVTLRGAVNLKVTLSDWWKGWCLMIFKKEQVMAKISLAGGRWHSVSLAFVGLVKGLHQQTCEALGDGLILLHKHRTRCVDRGGVCGKLPPDFDVSVEWSWQSDWLSQCVLIWKKKILKPKGNQCKQELKVISHFLSRVKEVRLKFPQHVDCPHSGRGHRNSKLALVSQQDSFHVDKSSCQIAGEVRMYRSKVTTQCWSLSLTASCSLCCANLNGNPLWYRFKAKRLPHSLVQVRDSPLQLYLVTEQPLIC